MPDAPTPRFDLEIRSAAEVSLPRQTELFNAAFDGYVGGTHTFDLAGFARLLALQGVDLWISRVACLEGEPVGFALLNRTGDCARLAGMGVQASARRLGVARRLLAHVVGEARHRGERLMTLEVFEQNPAALALYRQMGFEEAGRLFGWRYPLGQPPTIGNPVIPSEMPLLRITDRPECLEYPIIPWQVSRHAVAKAPPLARAYAASTARVVLSNPDADPIRLFALMPGGDDAARWAELRDLVASLIHRFPERSWHAPAVFPERFGLEVFRPLGFVRESLNQFLMHRRLD